MVERKKISIERRFFFDFVVAWKCANAVLKPKSILTHCCIMFFK
jgi:hypothetical protein